MKNLLANNQQQASQLLSHFSNPENKERLKLLLQELSTPRTHFQTSYKIAINPLSEEITNPQAIYYTLTQTGSSYELTPKNLKRGKTPSFIKSSKVFVKLTNEKNSHGIFLASEKKATLLVSLVTTTADKTALVRGLKSLAHSFKTITQAANVKSSRYAKKTSLL